MPHERSSFTAKGGRGPRRAAAAFALAALLALAAVVAVAPRRLHFDEALVVRSGWLLAGGVPSAPPFAMPATLAAGAAARAIPDPGVLFLLLRLVTAACVLGALAFAARRACASAEQAACAVGLTLLTYAFVAHGLEFRYDAAILAGLLAALGFAVRGRESDFAPLGAAAAFVAAHHAKGMLLGAAVLALGVLRAGGERRCRLRLFAGAGVTFGAWLAVAAACGALGAWIDTALTFGRLGATAGTHVWPWASPMARTAVLDLAFWLAALAAAGTAVAALAGRRAAAWREEPATWGLLFFALTLGFPLLHPMPWPYMLALPVPFGAILIARAAPGWASGRGRFGLVALAAAAVLAQTFVAGSPVGAAYWASVAAPREPEVEALRALRRLARPGEGVFDPSGVAYFLPPCTREWYVDTLFEPGARAGTWMPDAARLTPGACPWVLFTYRLGLLPDATQALLAAGWERRAWGLGLRRGDPRLAELPPPRRDDEVTTFW